MRLQPGSMWWLGASLPGILPGAQPHSDRRYANLLRTPAAMTHLWYDAQEVRLSTSSPSWARLRAKVDAFWGGVDAQVAGRAVAAPIEEGCVGVLFGCYDDVDAAGVVEKAILRLGWDPVRLPNRLSIACLRELQRCDWVIADVTDPAIEPITAFLHGQSVPVLRVRRGSRDTRPSIVEDVLFGDLTVGYRKDVTHWATEAELRDSLRERLDVITQQAELIGDPAAAIAYFSSQPSARIRCSSATQARTPTGALSSQQSCVGGSRRSSTTATLKACASGSTGRIKSAAGSPGARSASSCSRGITVRAATAWMRPVTCTTAS